MAQLGGRGRVKLGSLGSLSAGLVAPALARFNRTHPSVDCMLKSADHEVLVQMLVDGIVDLGVIVWPCPESAAAELAAIFLLQEPVVLVAHPRHPLATRKSPSREEVAQLAQPFFRLRWWPAHHPELVRLAERAGTAMEVPMEIARHLALRELWPPAPPGAAMTAPEPCPRCGKTDWLEVETTVIERINNRIADTALFDYALRVRIAAGQPFGNIGQIDCRKPLAPPLIAAAAHRERLRQIRTDVSSSAA